MVVGIVFLGWIVSGPKLTESTRKLGISLTAAFSFIAAWYIERSSRRRGMPEGVASGLRLIAGSQLLCGMGTLYGLASFIYNPRETARFDFADIFYVASYPMIMAGLLRFPRAERPSASRSRIMIDVAVFLAGIGLPLWYFTVLPGLGTSSRFEAVLVVAYPLASLSGISVLNQVLLTRAPLPASKPFFFLIAAICVWWISDLIYLLDTVPGVMVKGPVDWSNASTTLSLVLFLAAAGRMDSLEDPPSRKSSPAASSPLPFLTVIAVGGWLILTMANGPTHPESTPLITASLALLFVILGLREAFVYRDGAQWISAEVERESKARFELLIRNCTDVIMLVDPSGIVQFASPAVAGTLGIPASEVEGKPLLGRAHPEDTTRASGFLDRVMGFPKLSHNLRWRLRHENGSYRTLETVGMAVVGETALGGMVITSRDITDQIGLEERLRQSEKLEAISHLVGGIAHNFNNILTSTMVRLGFLKELSTLPAEVAEEIGGLDREAVRSAELTRKLVMFSRQQHLLRKPIDAREAVARMQPALLKLLGTGIQLYLTGGSAPEYILADIEMLEYVVVTLCENARDAMPNGGCLIIEVTEVDHVNLAPGSEGEARPDSAVRISFQDTGCGMERAVLDRIFEPFFTTKGVSVLGLGLASVHGAVKQHDGWIQVESAPGLGTTVRVFFPRVPAPAE